MVDSSKSNLEDVSNINDTKTDSFEIGDCAHIENMDYKDQEKITVEEEISITRHLSLKFKPFMCDICNESFPKKSHLTRHSSQHKFKCNVCKKMFTQKCSLKTHYLIHEGTKPYKCEVCGRGFGDRSTLRKHSLIHSGTRPHVCHMCNRSFVQKVTLRKHILTHTGEKAHTCEICGRAFAQKSTLRTHYRTHSTSSKRGRKQEISTQIPCIYLPKDTNASSVSESSILDEENEDLFKITCEGYCQSKKMEDLSSSHESTNLNQLKEDNQLIQLVKIAVESDEKILNENPLLEFGSEPLVMSTNCIPNIKGLSSTNQHSCKIFNLSFPESFLLVKHSYSHVDESQKSPNVISTVKKTSKEPHVSQQLCDNANFCKKSMFQNRDNYHLNNIEHICDYCGRTFSGTLELEKHYQIHISDKNRKNGRFEKGKQTELSFSSNMPFSESKRKQRLPKKVLQVPDVANNYNLSITETRCSPNKQLRHISSKFSSNDQWKKKNLNNRCGSPSEELLLKYLVPCIELIEPAINIHESSFLKKKLES